MLSIFKIRVRLKCLFFLFAYTFSMVLCNFHNHHRKQQQQHEIADTIDSNVANYSSAFSRHNIFSFLNESTSPTTAHKKMKRHHHRHNYRHSHLIEPNGLHHKRNTNNLANNKPDAKRDYVSAIVGKDVQLDCKISELVHDDDKIVWLKMPKGEVLTLNSNRVTQDQRINAKCVKNMLPCWSIVIENTKESDSGFYVCQTNAMQTKYVYLDIMVPPKLLTQYPLDRIDVNQTMNASIKCEFYGKPEPLIKWYKYHRGAQKEMEKYRGQTTINLFIHKDSASIYECVADNSIPPTVSKKIYLNIQHSPQIKFLNSRVFQKVGERVIFDCHVNSNPPAKVTWFKNQKLIHESNKYVFESLESLYHRLYINNLTTSDFTDYQCSAENMLGKSYSKIELVELPSEKVPITTEIILLPSTTLKFDETSVSNSPLITYSSSSETNKNYDKILQETVVEIPFASTESDLNTKSNTEFIIMDHANPHHDATISSSNDYSTNRPNKLIHPEHNKTKHKIHRQNQYKRKQTPYRHRQIMTTSSISKVYYENNSMRLGMTSVYALIPILSCIFTLNNL